MRMEMNMFVEEVKSLSDKFNALVVNVGPAMIEIPVFKTETEGVVAGYGIKLKFDLVDVMMASTPEQAAQGMSDTADLYRNNKKYATVSIVKNI